MWQADRHIDAETNSARVSSKKPTESGVYFQANHSAPLHRGDPTTATAVHTDIRWLCIQCYSLASAVQLSCPTPPKDRQG